MFRKDCLPIIIVLCLAVFLGAAGTAAALTEVYLRAEATVLNLPDSLGATTAVPMWGFAQDTAFGALDGEVSVPGPVLRVPPGETVLRIHLDNNLPEMISVHINGLSLTNNSGPVFAELGDAAVYSPVRPASNFTARVRSFGHETPPGNTTAVIYEFQLRPGTYLYASGTNPAKQVQMGLYGALAVDESPGFAYPGVSYTRDLVMVYSEVDPVINSAIQAGQYGPGGTITSSLKRKARYYLINGMAYDATAADGGGLDPLAFVDRFDKVLIRSVNAGYDTHVPQLLNMYAKMVAEDGSPYAYPKLQYGFQLPAGKTIDAVLEPATEGKYTIHDAALYMTNNGTAPPGGMLAYYGVGCAGDFNYDGSVNILDYQVFVVNFGNNCPPGDPCPGDVNKDGNVNILDYQRFVANFGRNDCPKQ